MWRHSSWNDSLTKFIICSQQPISSKQLNTLVSRVEYHEK